jgi:hypothetical protein
VQFLPLRVQELRRGAVYVLKDARWLGRLLLGEAIVEVCNYPGQICSSFAPCALQTIVHPMGQRGQNMQNVFVFAAATASADSAKEALLPKSPVDPV